MSILRYTSTMKITSLNLQGFDHWQERQPAILAYLHAEAPDIILFQEAVFLPNLSPFNQAQLLNAELGYAYEHSAISRLQVGHEYPVYREGLAALSRYPIVRSDILSLTKDPTDEHQRIIQLLDIYIDGAVTGVANVHFSITDDTDYATPQLEETLEILHTRRERRIIAGDYNLNDLEATSALWRQAYRSSSAYEYTSYPGMQKRNDYVLIPKDLRFTDVSVSGDGLSDHRALTVTVAPLHVRAHTTKRHQLAKSPRN